MDYEWIRTAEELTAYCGAIAAAPRVCFDTEFVSEHTYRPELCLVQAAVGDRLTLIDPLAIGDVRPFWEVIGHADVQGVVHAGREEFRFCHQAIGRRPANLFDVQLAAGLVGLEYPAALRTLLSRLLKKNLKKGETRTDWRKRPLTEGQTRYALLDVVHLDALRSTLLDKLVKLDRLAWFEEEMDSWQDAVEEAELRRRWRKVSGISGLSARQLAIVRELYLWREREAERRNSPPKRVLRDDLIVELARRQTDSPKQIQALRGMDRRDLRPLLPALAEAIQAALALPDEELPRSNRRDLPPQLGVLSQFLATAVGNVCRQQEVAPSLVCSTQGIRDLIAFRLGYGDEDEGPPKLLTTGWRKEIVGSLVEDMLDGRLALRVSDPHGAEPLSFERM